MIRAGSPCIIRLGTQKLCIRVDEAVGVLVRTAGRSPGRVGTPWSAPKSSGPR